MRFFGGVAVQAQIVTRIWCYYSCIFQTAIPRLDDVVTRGASGHSSLRALRHGDRRTSARREL